MLKILRGLLQQIIDDIDSGNSHASEEQQLEAIKLIQKMTSKRLSKIASANYIGVSRATFDNYIQKGWIPEGTKEQGFKELSWSVYDLDEFLKIWKKK